MVNKIIIDVDTDRKPNILIGHPPESDPKTVEETKTMVMADISCIFEAFCTLVLVADKSGYGKKEDFIMTSITQLNAMLTENKREEANN